MLSTTRRSPHAEFGVICRIDDRDITQLNLNWPDILTHTDRHTYRVKQYIAIPSGGEVIMINKLMYTIYFLLTSKQIYVVTTFLIGLMWALNICAYKGISTSSCKFSLLGCIRFRKRQPGTYTLH